MIRTFALAFLILPTFFIKAQSIIGNVMELGTGKPVPYANVYFNGTSYGTSSDSLGVFIIAPPPYKTTLIISAVSFNSASVTDYLTGHKLKIYLKPKPYILDEVVVESKKNVPRQYLQIFNREFLGTSAVARQCEITNIQDLDFSYDRKTKTLKAFCDVPLIIQNRALGYLLYYDLNDFSKNSQGIFFSGHYRFKEDSTIVKNDLPKIAKKRKQAYLGSRMHFIRALCANDLHSSGFRIINNQGNFLKSSELLVQDQSHFNYIHTEIGKSLTVTFRYESSQFIIKEDFIPIDKNGYFDPGGIVWKGYMGTQRVGELLPFEYELK